MEEWVGGIWDRWITKTARRDHPEAAVRLADIEKTLGVVFRALGGDAGLRVAAASDQHHGARRRLLERIAGSGLRSAHAALDMETLRLPPAIAYFADRALNRDLYLWLTAVAAHEPPPSDHEWIVRNQQATISALHRFPGLKPRYERLVAAALTERIAPEAMPEDEAAQERAVRAALTPPGTVPSLPTLSRAKAKTLQPVPLWLYPAPAALARGKSPQNPNPDAAGDKQ